MIECLGKDVLNRCDGIVIDDQKRQRRQRASDRKGAGGTMTQLATTSNANTE